MSSELRPPSTPKTRPHSRLLHTPSQNLLNITPSRPASPILQGNVQLPPSSFVEPEASGSSLDPDAIYSPDAEPEPEGPLANEPSPEESVISASPPSSQITPEAAISSGAGHESASQTLREQLRRTLSHRSVGSTRSSPHARRAHLAEEPLLSATSEYPPLSATEAQRFEDRKYYVLTNAGKPVFMSDRGESDEEATNAMGIMQALISVFAEDGDKVRYITAGSTRITFLLRSPLYYVCVSSWGEPGAITKTHLDYLHLQILSTLTLPQLTKLFERRGNFDLGRLLTGAEPLIRFLLHTAQTSMETTLSAMQCLRMDMGKRRRIGEALLPSSSKLSLVYAMVMAAGKVITLVRPRKHSINPSDLHLLLNTISFPSLLTQDSESWLPICLPRFNADGFLYTYVGALREGFGLVGLCADRDGWDGMREWRAGVEKKLEEESLLSVIEKAALTHSYAVVELGIHGLRHFVYKSRINVQFTQPEFDAPYDTEIEQRRLVTLYQQVHDALHARSGQKEALTLQYIRTPREAVMGWITKPFELYLALSPHLPKPACVTAANMVVNWVKKEESRLFLRDAPVF